MGYCLMPENNAIWKPQQSLGISSLQMAQYQEDMSSCILIELKKSFPKLKYDVIFQKCITYVHIFIRTHYDF
jgi:hypothetical protein